jgi:hypothetical protein
VAEAIAEFLAGIDGARPAAEADECQVPQAS